MSSPGSSIVNVSHDGAQDSLCKSCFGLSKNQQYTKGSRMWFPARYVEMHMNGYFGTSDKCSFCAVVVEGFWHFASKLGYAKGQPSPDFRNLSAVIYVPTGDRGVCTVIYEPRMWSVPSRNTIPQPKPYRELQREWSHQELEFKVAKKYIGLPWSEIPVAAPAASMESCTKTITKWLTDCLEEHGDACSVVGKDRAPNWVPTRLIHLGKDNNDMRLMVMAGREKVAYTALSYCWGQPPTSLTVKGNINDRLKSLKWQDLSRCHQDAVELTRRLGVSYIWLDSICILQKDARDWEIESALMAKIYGNALVTISSAHAGDVRQPLISQQKFITLPNPRYPKTPGDPDQVLATRPIDHRPMAYDESDDKHDWPMFSRAWTFQERFLASRVVHFTPDEMMWECRMSQTCECGYMEHNPAQSQRWLTDRLFAYQGDEALQDAACSIWMMTLLVASDRLLSRDQDRLVALSGLAERYSSLGLGRYYGGLWECAFIPSLCWYSQGHGRLRRPRRYQNEPSDYVAPSWSWASVVGPVWYDAQLLLNRNASTFHATTNNVDHQLAGPEVFGALKSASLTLTAPALDIVYHENEANPIAMDDMSAQSRLIFDIETPRAMTRERWGPVEIAQGETLKCLFIWTLLTPEDYAPRMATALLLKKVSVGTTAETYKRVGIVDLRPWEHEISEAARMAAIRTWVGDLCEQTVTII